MNYPLFIVSGPSSVGKTTIIKRLLKELPQLQKAVSYTTRKQRRGSVEDKIMHYTDAKTFKTMIENQEFIEWAKVYGNYYGTHKPSLEKLLRTGPVILNLDVQGSLQIKNKMPEARLIFILPDSIEILRKRLTERLERTHDPEDMQRRITEAEHEIEQAGQFHYQVVNETGKLNTTLAELKKIIGSELKS